MSRLAILCATFAFHAPGPSEPVGGVNSPLAQAPALPAIDDVESGGPARPVAAAARAVNRVAILARDPRAFARAPEGAWRNFDMAQFRDDAVVQSVLRARDDILRGDLVAALGELHGILAVRLDFPPALHMSGVIYFRLQRYGDSAEMMRRYVEVAPERLGDTRVLGHDLYTLGRYGEALAHYERVLERAPNDAEAWRGSALAAWRLGEPKDALARLDKAIALAPKNDEFRSWKAAILFDEGELDAAKAAAESAIALDSYEPRTWFTLARVLEESGENAGATTARARFARLAATAAAVRAAETRLVLEPDVPARVADWIDACTAFGAPGPLRGALQRVSQWPLVLEDAQVLRAELEACRVLRDPERGGAAARALESRAGDDLRCWSALAAWYESIVDEAGLARARSRLER